MIRQTIVALPDGVSPKEESYVIPYHVPHPREQKLGYGYPEGHSGFDGGG